MLLCDNNLIFMFLLLFVNFCLVWWFDILMLILLLFVRILRVSILVLSINFFLVLLSFWRFLLGLRLSELLGLFLILFLRIIGRFVFLLYCFVNLVDICEMSRRLFVFIRLILWSLVMVFFLIFVSELLSRSMVILVLSLSLWLLIILLCSLFLSFSNLMLWLWWVFWFV